MPSTLVVLAGPPLPGRGALARALEKRLGARRFRAERHGADEIDRVLGGGASAVVEGDFRRARDRARVFELQADERVLVEWICCEEEAQRQIFHRYASRPRALAELELARYLAYLAEREPAAEDEVEVLVEVGAQAPLGDQVIRVLSSLRPRAAPGRDAERRRRSVILVEDEAEQRELFREVLAELGCRVETADDAAGALAILEADAEIDYVISDQYMPGMSGVELARVIAWRYPHVRTLLLTAHPDATTCLGAIGAHAAGVLTKPLRVVDLQRMIDESPPRSNG